MRVIFLEDVPNVAHAGDIKNVKDGYARNYLIPKKIASVATAEHMKRVDRIKKAGDERRARETKQWEELAALLEGASVSVTARATPAGEFYGAITQNQIASELSESIGREIDRKIVETVSPIREPGEYDVVLNLAPGIQANIQVVAQALE